MPIKKAAMKALRQAKKRTVQNAKIKQGISYLRKMVRKSLDSKEVKEAEEFIRSSVKAVDKAVQNKVMKANTASRIKSRLMKKLNVAKSK